MKNFGKLTGYPEKIKISEEVVDEKGKVLQPAHFVSIIVLKNNDGVEWHDLFKQFPHPFYIVIDDEGRIISMTSDPEQSQISDYEIIGIDSDFGETWGGPGCSVYGKLWDGEKIIDPPVILPNLTSRQFWQAALVIGVTEESLVSAITTKGSPLYIADQAEREEVKIDITKATTFNRDFPLLKTLAAVNGLSESQLNDLWLWASRLE